MINLIKVIYLIGRYGVRLCQGVRHGWHRKRCKATTDTS